MKISSSLYLALSALAAFPAAVLGLSAGDADAMYSSWNKNFLRQNSTYAAYQSNITGGRPDKGWTQAYDLFIPQDVYLRRGDNATKQLVALLCESFLQITSPGSGNPWHDDGYNDDIGWYTIALIRGYQITGNETYLNLAKSGFDYAFARGWNTTTNDGGIWESQPDKNDPSKANKQPLSTDSLAKTACMIYQSTHDAYYLGKCQQIWDWVTSHIYNSTTGEVYAAISQTGEVTKERQAYNQGTFLDLTALLYRITGNTTYYNNAKLAIDFGRSHITVGTKQIFSSSNYNAPGWADEFARGAGSFVGDNNLWGTYYGWMADNADAALAARNAKYNITWNNWTSVTPDDPQHFDGSWTLPLRFAGAVAWLQYTPATQPTSKVAGLRSISNKQTALAVDSADAWGNGKSVVQGKKVAGGTQAQRWQMTQNSGDSSWNIINLSTWQALQANTAGSNSSVVQWRATRDDSQRWAVDEQTDGSFKITNKLNGLVLDAGDSSDAGAPLVLSQWTGANKQRWTIS